MELVMILVMAIGYEICKVAYAGIKAKRAQSKTDETNAFILPSEENDRFWGDLYDAVIVNQQSGQHVGILLRAVSKLDALRSVKKYNLQRSNYHTAASPIKHGHCGKDPIMEFTHKYGRRHDIRVAIDVSGSVDLAFDFDILQAKFNAILDKIQSVELVLFTTSIVYSGTFLRSGSPDLKDLIHKHNGGGTSFVCLQSGPPTIVFSDLMGGGLYYDDVLWVVPDEAAKRKAKRDYPNLPVASFT